MRALAFANGEAPSAALVAELRPGAELIVAADGGARHALANGLTPDAVVGDFDSIDDELRSRIPPDRFHRAGRMDTTTWKSGRLRRPAGCEEVDILGAGGGRSDHALANLSVLTSTVADRASVSTTNTSRFRSLMVR